MLLILSGIYVLVLRSDVSTLNDQVSELKRNNLVLTTGAKDTDALVQSLQGTLDTLKANEASREEIVRTALASAEIASKKNEEYGATLLASTPKSTDLCKEANDLVDQYLVTEGVK